VVHDIVAETTFLESLEVAEEIESREKEQRNAECPAEAFYKSPVHRSSCPCCGARSSDRLPCGAFPASIALTRYSKTRRSSDPRKISDCRKFNRVSARKFVNESRWPVRMKTRARQRSVALPKGLRTSENGIVRASRGKTIA
jgi:hypothetical protein